MTSGSYLWHVSIVGTMGHQQTPGGAEMGQSVYNHGSVAEDPLASKEWNDELVERINLRLPKWMHNEIEVEAEHNHETPAETARGLIEYALMHLDERGWPGINSYGKHTYGDLKCPACMTGTPVKLRWSRSRQGDVLVDCKGCGAEFLAETGREVNTIDESLQSIWSIFVKKHLLDHDLSIYDAPAEFEAFTEDPRSFVEKVEWSEDSNVKSRVVERVAGTGTADTEKDMVYSLLEAWESGSDQNN